ncbi:MAG TPA: hypothetical protein VF614_09405 [Chthoniobacteraceae bacterium]
MAPAAFHHIWLFLVAFCAGAAVLHGEDFQGSTHKVEFEGDVIRYNETPANSAIERLQARIDSGEVKLTFDDTQGYLPSLLEALEVPKSSQLLVFSKTSLQRSHISPKRPRALYFNDDVYIGFIPGAPLLEVSVADPKLGAVFYELEQTKLRKPKLVRSNDCLQCHSSGRSMGVPGHVIRSVGTNRSGEIDNQTEVSEITHCTPLADRWAGWYVTGTHGAQTHRGNLLGLSAFERHATEPNHAGNIQELNSFFDTSRYPKGSSDIVAHMVLEHQSHMHNYLTRLNFETQIMMSQYGHIRYLERQVTAFLRYLLFTEETPLTEKIAGDPEFAQEFTGRGPKDKQGRSLRDFDLEKRLFKYPCSFLIYSEAFDNLPPVMKEHVLQRLWNILNSKEPHPDFAKLPESDRAAIKEILIDTKAGLPDYWNAGST